MRGKCANFPHVCSRAFRTGGAFFAHAGACRFFRAAARIFGKIELQKSRGGTLNYRVKKNPKILFVVNIQKPDALDIAHKLAGMARRGGLDVEISTQYPTPEEYFRGIDTCCVIGGDGTILSCAKMLAKYSVPVFGINLGKLGFLATYSGEIDEELFLLLARGEGKIFERAMLSATYENKTHLVLNDFVLKDSRVNGISKFRIYADNEFIAEYVGDGLIFSTPTGSTAYNLSAGGPIIHPKSRTFVMTPICPHTLSNRSLVLSYGTLVRLMCVSGESVLMADGRQVATMASGAELELYMPPCTVKFMRKRGHSHFGILRSKLGWADDPREIETKLRASKQR